MMWWIVGLYAVLVAGALLVNSLPRFRGREAQRMSRSVGLALSPEREVTIQRRLVVRRRGALIGSMLGQGASALFLESVVITPERELGMLSLMLPGGTFAGLAVGVAVVAALTRSRGFDDQPRFARAEAVSINDYVPWIFRWGARVPVALATMMLLISLVLSLTPSGEAGLSPLFLAGGLLTAAAIASLLFFEIASRRLVRRAQPAGSPSELAWDDAVRSATMQDLAAAPFVLGGYSTALMLVELAAALSAVVSRVGILIGVNVVGNVMFYTLVLAMLFLIASRPQRHFLRRLWPELAEAASSRPVGVADDRH